MLEPVNLQPQLQQKNSLAIGLLVVSGQQLVVDGQPRVFDHEMVTQNGPGL
jgi:hypothetical protein